MNLEPHVKRIAIAVVLGSIMSVLSTTIVNVALETLSVKLDSPLDDVQWVVTSYMLALAAVIPVSGWAANRFGARRLYVLSLILFTAGSALCGFAWNLETLIGARVLQGLAGGLLVPIGQMVLVRAAGPGNMARVMSAIGVPIILAPVFGPTLGGLLVEHISWQAIFFVNVPVGIVAAVAALRLLPRDEIAGLGFFVCVEDLEGEMIRALGTDRVVEVIGAAGETRPWETMRQQPAQEGRPIDAQLRRFMGTRGGRKIRYGTLLADALDLGRIPTPLAALLDHV